MTRLFAYVFVLFTVKKKFFSFAVPIIANTLNDSVKKKKSFFENSNRPFLEVKLIRPTFAIHS